MADQTNKIILEKVISGGQTGADLAALEAAKLLGLETGGVAPPNYMTTDGANYELKTKFGLQCVELNKDQHKNIKVNMSIYYVKRSKINVDNADATVVFRIRSSPGTDKTIGYCLSKIWKRVPPELWHKQKPAYRPVFIVTSSVAMLGKDEKIAPITWKKEVEDFREFLREYKVKVLNVAGHRATQKDPTWKTRITAFLMYALA